MKTLLKKSLAFILCFALLGATLSIGVFAEDSLSQGTYTYTEGDYEISYDFYPAQGEFQGRIMFVHGFLFSSETWRGMAGELSQKGYDCYSVDLPNYGDSTREKGDTEFIDREDLVVGLMETVAPLDGWILAGHSMGGGVAMNIACDHPELQALLLYCPSEINMPGESILNPLTESKAFQKLFTGLFSGILRLNLVVKIAMYAVTGDRDFAFGYDISSFTSPLLKDGTATGIFYSTAKARNTDMEAVSKITVPTMLLWAEGDSVLSSANVSAVTAALPAAEVHTVEGSHLVIETDYQSLSLITEDFLKGN